MTTYLKLFFIGLMTRNLMNRLQTKRKGARRGVRLRIGQWFVDPLAVMAVRERRGPGDRSRLERIRNDRLALH
jgi:hypothetical protein